MSFETPSDNNIDAIKGRIADLKQREEEQQVTYRELNARRMRREITAEEFSVAYAPINTARSGFYAERLQAETELRLARIDSINSEIQKDEKMSEVDVFVENGVSDLIKENIQKGGSNAQGVFELRGRDDLVTIKKSESTYQYIGELPARMVKLKENKRIPRVLKAFQEAGSTWLIAEKARGRECSELVKEKGVGFLKEIPEEHFRNLISDIKQLNDVGLNIDPSKHSNVFYDPEIGFSIIDIGYEYEKESKDRKYGQINVAEVASFLTGSMDSEETEFLRDILTRVK